MYNRYVQRSDGSFERTKLPDAAEKSDYGPVQKIPEPPYHRIPESGTQTAGHGNALGIGTFFKNLLPHGLDTEDLIVILLLLLLSQDGSRNGNRALLTLGAYLFL